MNKGQFEIMGLAFLVVIITLGILIFFVLNQGREDENVVKQYSNSEFAQGYIKVLLKTTTTVAECKGYDVGELLKDCASPSKSITCNGVSSCDKVSEIAHTTLEKTLEKYKKMYTLKIEKNAQLVIPIQSTGSCIEKERPGRQPLPNGVIVTLEICG